MPSKDESAAKLCELMTFLRTNCNWDKEQTLASLRTYLLEESYEVLDALDQLSLAQTPSAIAEHREELGDLLFQIVFQAEIQREQGHFDFADVCQGVHDKLVRRHPHLFADAQDQGALGENPHWERVKAEERAKKNKAHKSVLDGIPPAMPALVKAQRTSEKAAKVGFDWPDAAGAMLKVDEEVQEIKEAMTAGNLHHIEHELGDLLLAAVELSRHHKLEAETCLRKAVARFTSRFHHLEDSLQKDNLAFNDVNLDELERRWQAAKKAL
jgi:MazG family protein